MQSLITNGLRAGNIWDALRTDKIQRTGCYDAYGCSATADCWEMRDAEIPPAAEPGKPGREIHRSDPATRIIALHIFAVPPHRAH